MCNEPITIEPTPFDEFLDEVSSRGYATGRDLIAWDAYENGLSEGIESALGELY